MANELDGRASLRVMREAASRFIAKRGLREFSRQLDMSASGADKLTKEGTNPQGPTLRRFRSWYLQAYASGDVGGTPDGPALIGIRLLVQDLPKPRQKAAALHIIAVQRKELEAEATRAPAWLGRLKKSIEADWP